MLTQINESTFPVGQCRLTAQDDPKKSKDIRANMTNNTFNAVKELSNNRSESYKLAPEKI